MTNPERCSCGAREKNKCSKESEHGGGKMCLKSAEQSIQDWSKDFTSKQETLPTKFQKILADNFWELVEE